MKDTFVVSRENMLRVVECLELVPERPSILSSELIRVEKSKHGVRMQLASEVAGEVLLKGSGSWNFKKAVYIDRRLLFPFVNAAKNIHSKSDFVITKLGEKEIQVKNGSRRARLQLSHATSGYSPAPKRQGHEVKLEKELASLLLSGKLCADQQVSVPEISCVYALRTSKELVLYSTTGRVYFRAHLKSGLNLKRPLPFPLFSIGLLSYSGLKGVEATDQDVVLLLGIGKVWQTIAVNAKKKFPREAIDKFFRISEKTSKEAFRVNSQLFTTILARLASYMASVRRLDWVLHMEAEKGSNEVQMSVSVGSTVYREKLAAEKPCSSSFKVDWPLDMVLEVLVSVAKKNQIMILSADKENRWYARTGAVELLIPRRTK